jgi:P4 family phage/plasmid primase-like protien
VNAYEKGPRLETGAPSKSDATNAKAQDSASRDYSDQSNESLSAAHLIDLMENHAIGVDILQAVNARDYPRGVVIDWTDDSASNPAGRIDPDKRTPDHKGKVRKTDWPKGQTLNLSMARRSDSADELIIEGFCQHLAVASWAPEQYGVTGMNGCNGIHDRTDLDWVKDKRVVLGLDADRRTNLRVKAAARAAARHLYQAGAESVRVIDYPRELVVNDNDGPDDFLARMPEEDREAAIAGWAENATLIPKVEESDQFSDAAMAGVVADEVFAGKVIWAAGRGWMRWTGQVWEAVDDTVPMELIRQFVLGRYAAAAAAGQRNEATSWGRLLSRGRGLAVLGYAKGIVRVKAADMDAYPDLLNCPNGVVDLRTGALGPSDPGLLMTKMAGADYRPGATHPDWDKALKALPEDVRGWFQLRLGQALTGHMTPDDVAVISQGGGSNGKSCCNDACALAAGGYHIVIADRAMLGGASDNHPTEMMDFQGARYAVLEETSEARRLDTNRLKKLTGTREISARRIRQDSTVFQATHSLFVNTNYKPIVTETDHGTWRRLALLRWPYTFRKTQAEVKGPNDRLGDPTLRDRIKLNPQALEAALAWMAEGARRWYELEKIMPELPGRVETDTLQWRKESDVVLAHIGEYMTFDRGAHVIGSELRKALNAWLVERGAQEWGEKTFVSRFGGHDEVVQHNVEYKLIKRRDGLSRPPGTGPFGNDHADVKDSYRAWLGLRFLTPKELAEAAEEGADQDQVTGVTGADKSPREMKNIPVNPRPVTPVTAQVSGLAVVCANPFCDPDTGCGVGCPQPPIEGE